MFKYSKFCSYFCLFVYILMSTNSANWLIYKTGELAFGIVYNDYACKGGDCGCDSALKCLTNCCCSKVNYNGKIVAACKADVSSGCCSEGPTEAKSESCCSDTVEVETCCSEVEKSNLPIVFISDADCSPDSENSFLEKTRIHLLAFSEEVELKELSVKVKWNRSNSFYNFTNPEKILKIPIA